MRETVRLTVERDVAATMRDGVTLYADVYRPEGPGRWPVILLLPLGFALMAAQGVSEIIKRIAALEHAIDDDFKYEKPLQ